MSNIKSYALTSPASAAAETGTSTSEQLASTGGRIGTIMGDIGSGDIIIPKLNIVQGVGPLSETHTPGQIVYDRSIVLSDGTTPVELTILSARKQFVENVPYDSGIMPQTYDTEEEVKAVGGTTVWMKGQKPSYQPVLHVQMLVKTTGIDGAFPLEHNGEHYALALWSLRNTAYTRAAKMIMTAARFSLTDGLHQGKWMLTTKREKFGRNSVFVPVLSLAGRHDAEFVSYVEKLM